MKNKRRIFNLSEIIDILTGQVNNFDNSQRWKATVRRETLEPFFLQCKENEIPYSEILSRKSAIKDIFVNKEVIKNHKGNNYNAWVKDFEKDFLKIGEMVYQNFGPKEIGLDNKKVLQETSSLAESQAKEFYDWVRNNITEDEYSISKMANIYSSAFGLFIDELVKGSVR